MFCGLCVEACPYDALFMGSGFEQGRYSRKEMVIGLDQLRQAEKNPSTYFRPQLESASYDPRGGRPLDWKDVGRESWRWHQREKAGMRLAVAPALDGGDPPSLPLREGANGGVDPASSEEND
jgi:ferredoxin